MKTPTEEQIRRRAYEIYEKRGQPGRDTENWLQAERELAETIKVDDREASVWEDTSSRRRAGDVKVRPKKPRGEFSKGF